MAREIKDLSLLIQPPAAPSVWESCAKILYEKSDLELEAYLSQLLEWLQDLNWPGSMTILNRLKRYSGEILRQPFIDAFNTAIAKNDDSGLVWLDYLSELLDNDELLAELPTEIVDKLKKHYRKWGDWYDESVDL